MCCTWCLYVVTQIAVKYVTGGAGAGNGSDWVSCCVFLATALLLKSMLTGEEMRYRFEAYWGDTKAYNLKALKGIVNRNYKLSLVAKHTRESTCGAPQQQAETQATVVVAVVSAGVVGGGSI